ncbi:telomere length regulation protein TEL2 homolog [Coregonus clupeaformis]|uniref:telomere length regulation protein TEL2 homolog n=1 Tax=Coregonus clupeaformis TaxID=59861 RepID=UPI001BE052E5|nr:telomere length regulation protein TEL2 homolog [Coregonus clupeaformis]
MSQCDSLTPYDMSADQEMSQAAPPCYHRDCLEAFLSSEDPVRVELSLSAVEGLVRKNTSKAREWQSRNRTARPQNITYTELWETNSSMPLVEPGLVFTTPSAALKSRIDLFVFV